MENRSTIVLVLRSGGDFQFRDVELIARHINGKWKSPFRPRIICLWDKATSHYDLGNIELIPLANNWPKWWSRMTLYSPEMEQYRPFLYIDLDTVIVQSLEKIFELVKDPSMFIPLEDFYQKGRLATGMAWIPANSNKIAGIWEAWQKTEPGPRRMDYFLRTVVTPDVFWQQLTDTIYNLKPYREKPLQEIPSNATVICFHGKPRIFDAAFASINLPWVTEYVTTEFTEIKKKVTVIIPYDVNRGFLKDAIDSIPNDVQLLVSQGKGNWPENFNKVLDQAKGDYIKFLHEDDMLTENSIKDAIEFFETHDVDFIHGDAKEVTVAKERYHTFRPKKENPTLEEMLQKNFLHSATLMYKKEIFEKLGGFDESLNVMEEYEFNLRCLKAGMKLGYCPSVLAIYRRHPKQKVRVVGTSEKRNERFMVREKYR